MSENKDPMDTLRKAMGDLEARFDEMAKAVFGTDAFARTSHRATELGTKVQQGVADQMSKNLAFWNMPSREDVTAIAERLMTMDERLIRIEEALARLAPDDGKPKSGPPRTKKPPAKKATEDKGD